MIRKAPYICLLAGLLCCMHPAIAKPHTSRSRPAKPADSFQVEGAVQSSRSWTVEQIKKDLATEIQTVDYELKGERAQAKVVLLRKLIELAKPKVDPKAKNHSLAFMVVVSAQDGYSIAFSMGELSDIGTSDVWIALDKNGQPLGDKEAPIRLIVPKDKKPARWLMGVRSIHIIDGKDYIERAAKK